PLLQGWIQRDVAVGLFKAAGLDFEAEKVRARTAGFRPVTLKGASFSAAMGDPVRHGAIDDGMGVAGVLEIARAFAHGPRPQRTVLFGVWTAEERGLLGSEYYAAHPTLPL